MLFVGTLKYSKPGTFFWIIYAITLNNWTELLLLICNGIIVIIIFNFFIIIVTTI
jgi:hypothetical protein